MREFKFRAWDFINNEMIHEVGITPKSDMSVPYRINPTYYDPEHVDYYPESKLMQFIGVHDKFGREIYEGDIIQICYDDDDWDTESYRSVVKWLGDGKWSEPAFDLDPQFLKSWSWHFDGNVLSGLALAEIYRYEVIGNIYENPELLKEGEEA